MQSADFFLNPQINNREIMTGGRVPNCCTELVYDTRFGDYSNLSVCASSPLNTSNMVPLQTRIPKVKQMEVTSCELPMTFKQYSQSLQNTSFGIGEYIVTVPDSNYTSSTLTTLLSNLSGTGIRFSVSDTGKITMTNITKQTQIIDNVETVVYPGNSVQVNFAVNAESTFDKYRLKSKLGWCVGFRKPSYTLAVDETIEAEYWFQTHPTRYVYLVVNDFIQQSRTSMQICSPESIIGGGAILAKIALDSVAYPYNTIVQSSVQRGNLVTGQRMYPGTTDLERLSIHVCNEYGRVLDLNQSDFSVGLRVTHMSM